MNLAKKLPTSFFGVPLSFWKNRYLIYQLIGRELSRRYRGSFLGVLWTLITPLSTLVIYTFVFSVVLKARWSNNPGQDSDLAYALILFTGYIPFNIFMEVVNIAPMIVLNNPNYVKKVIFPIEILPVVALGTSIVNSLFSLVVLLIGLFLLGMPLSATLILLPLAYFPLILIILGLSWFLASLGVFIRDMDQAIRIITQVIMFLTPIFYPFEMVPPDFKGVISANPFTFVVASFRQLILWGQVFSMLDWLLWTAVGVAIAALGYIWFQKSRKGFADVM